MYVCTSTSYKTYGNYVIVIYIYIIHIRKLCFDFNLERFFFLSFLFFPEKKKKKIVSGWFAFEQN